MRKIFKNTKECVLMLVLLVFGIACLSLAIKGIASGEIMQFISWKDPFKPVSYASSPGHYTGVLLFTAFFGIMSLGAFILRCMIDVDNTQNKNKQNRPSKKSKKKSKAKRKK